MDVAIVGCGALGIGFLLPILRKAGCKVTLYDKIPWARGEMHVRWVPKDNGLPYNDAVFWVRRVHRMRKFPVSQHEVVFTALPPSSLVEVAPVLGRLGKGTVVACENLHDPATFLQERFAPAGMQFVNGIAWVSAFQDEGRTWCDEGDLCLDADVGIKSPHFRVADMYHREYNEKRMLHNGPHAVLAYLGWKAVCDTIPEATGRLNLDPLWNALAQVFPSSSAKLEREVQRFSDVRFPDPIARVARSPWRKLMRGGRLPLLLNAVRDFSSAERLVLRAIDAAIDYGLLYDPVVAMWAHGWSRDKFKKEYCGLNDEFNNTPS
jgi:hypothetical protein